MNVAFIGIGSMGTGMAGNLVKAGHTVRAFDIDPAAMERAREIGCEVCASTFEAVQGVEAVISMLPDGRAVSHVWREEVFGNAPSGALLMDCSTIEVEVAKTLAQEAAGCGYAVLDGPCSGGFAGAKAGTLTFMVGGEGEAYERARPLLEAMGKTLVHAGPSGAGQAIKVCNNLMLGSTMIATCEALKLAEKLGVNLQTFYDVATKSTGETWSLTAYCPAPGVGPNTPADNDYKPGFSSALMLKDLRLALDAANQVGATLPMAARAEELYADFAAENAGVDFSAIIKTL